MLINLNVSVEVERTTGKFSTKDEIASQLVEAIESACNDTWEGDNGGEYETTDVTITQLP